MDTTRISDADRQRTAERLHAAVGEGRLDLTAYDDRVRLAYGAVTRADLDRVTADLPAAVVLTKTPAAPAPRWSAEWRSWFGVSLILISIWAATSLAAGHPIFFWPVFPVGIWAAAIVAQTVTGRPAHGGCATRR